MLKTRFVAREDSWKIILVDYGLVKIRTDEF